MVTSLVALQWTAVGGCILMGAVVAGAFLHELAGEFRRVPAAGWQPGGEWYGRTPTATELGDTRPLVLGMTAAAVEAEIARMIAASTEQPA